MPEEKTVPVGTDNLTPEQKAAVEQATNFMRSEVEKQLAQRPGLTMADVDKAVTKGISEIALANSPYVQDVQAKRRAEFRGKHLFALLMQFRGHPEHLEKLHKDYADLFFAHDKFLPAGETCGVPLEKAVIYSGSTTYSNVTPAIYYNEILPYQKNAIWHREQVRVVSNAGRTGVFPLGTSSRMTAYRNTEGSATTDSTPTMSADTYTCIPLSVGLPISNELLNQWGIAALGPWILDELGYAIAIKEFTEVLTGTNSTQMNGIETAIAGSTYEVTGGANDFELCRKLYRGLPMFYRPIAKFFCTSNTIAVLEALKTPAGNYILDATQPVLKLFGVPILESGTVGTDNRLNFGALTKFHLYENGSTMTVDDRGYTNTSTNSTYFHFVENNDGNPADVQAFRFSTLAGA